jgi:UDP-GlcNAc:undecaprenyl-phosphate/decaprenyl-phosphate GlcNAc-1-phosphate transferase
MTPTVVMICLAMLLIGAMVLSGFFTFVMIRVAPKLGFVDKPGGRKIHDNPKPLGGGVAITWGFVLPILIGSACVWLMPATFSNIDPALISGAKQQLPLALGFCGCVVAMHILGLFDDRKAMGPMSKLLIQLSITAVLVLLFPQVRVLDALGNTLGNTLGVVPSIVLTIVWIGAITNALNFLDNMDGLSAGVAAICATALMLCAIAVEQWFVAATVALFIGATLGFLFFNFPPAKIFMGDSGSLVLGFVLAVLTVRTTYLPAGESFASGWFAVLVPVIVLALPLYDLLVVSAIRISNGKSPFVGDTNHFSHRLVRRGMSKRTAVLCIYLVTASTSVAAVVLPMVSSPLGAMLIVIQTLLILGVVMLLEQHPVGENGRA